MLKKLKSSAKYTITSLLIVAVMLVTGWMPPQVHIAGNGNYLSISTQSWGIEASTKMPTLPQPSYLSTIVDSETWGYRLTLENGDVVEIGDSSTEDFKAMIKTSRWNGVASFSLGWLGGTFTPILNDETVSFDFNSTTHVDIYPIEPSLRLPEGGIEYDITLSKKPAKPEIILDIDWEGLTWEKILPLDEEYDEAKCIEDFGEQGSPYTITQTDITGSDLEVYKHIEEYEVNSYLGKAISPWVQSSGDLGGGVTYNKPSRSYLYIHRGQMTDALNDTAWVEDINIDEQAKTITFTLPTVWLRNAEYPVSQVCGVDPAYTEEMSEFGYGLTTGSWTSYDLQGNQGVPANAVAEFILCNGNGSAEEYIGVRAKGSSIDRRIQLEEAESGGRTTCRMFVQVDSGGDIEYYMEYSHAVYGNFFILVGYWENVTFTERWDDDTPDSSSSWDETVLTDSNSASLLCHFILINAEEDVHNIMGIRNTSSSDNRYIDLHEQEGGGVMPFDMLTKADESYSVDFYTADNSNTEIRNSGYFDSSLDFTEDFELMSLGTSATWTTLDMTSFLDEDGRVSDWAITHDEYSTENLNGIRDGDDGSTNRYLDIHETEGGGQAGFGISAITNLSGEVQYYAEDASHELFYFMGYFIPAAAPSFDITNSPSSEDLGVVADNSTYYAFGSAPSNPVQDAECTFTVTNNGTQCDLDMKITDFTTGTTWNIVSGDPTGNSNEVRVTAYYSGQNPASGLVLANTDAEFYDALANSATLKWDFKFETGVLTDEPNEHSATLTVTAVTED